MEAIQLIFECRDIPTEWKKTLITLIPKRLDVSLPSHYRPISLYTTLYKMYARILIDWLKPIMPRLISPEQGAFISGRSITNNILLA